VASAQLAPLRRWFPQAELVPMPSSPEAAARLLDAHDLVIQMHRAHPVPGLAERHPRVLHLEAVEAAPGEATMLRRFAAWGREALGLASDGIDNGLRPPPGLVPARHRDRVVLHPEASTPEKRWTPARWVAVARRLRADGLRPVFVMTAAERERWRPMLAGFELPELDGLDALATYLHESGCFAGNDSGIGHLASNVGLPTVTVFRRRRVSLKWRPDWTPGRVVLPARWIPTAALRERFWREGIAPARVARAVQDLLASDGAA
jgi:hypothetical protein